MRDVDKIEQQAYRIAELEAALAERDARMIVRGFDGRDYQIPTNKWGIYPIGNGGHVRVWAGGVTRLCPSKGLGDDLSLGFLKISHAVARLFGF